MAESRGTYGRLQVFEDFLGAPEVTAMTTVAASAGDIGYVSVNEGDIIAVVDEPGGVWNFTTDTADNDNFFLYSGPFKPADGGCAMEARFKIADITTGAVFCGFSETLDATTPVMPAEFDTVTMTINGAGGVAGMQFDSDGTLDYWRAACGNAGANATAAANGTVSPTAAGTQAMVNDEYDVVRVEIGADGRVDIYLAESNGILKLIASYTGVLTTTDLVHACLGIENRSGAASDLEVDYFWAEGGRDWTR